MAPTRPTETGSTTPVEPDTTAGEALIAYLAQPLLVLRTHRTDLPGETIHQLRTAARRLRSALASHAPILEGEEVEAVRGDLRWLGQSLAPARDVEVLAAHLVPLADELTGQFGDGLSTALRSRIEHDLGQAQATAHQGAREALSTPRFEQLVRSLETALPAVALRPEAGLPARTVLPEILARERRRVRRMGRGARGAEPGPDRDEALHDVRKAVKRLRYAAESATPVLGDRARELARRATSLQEALGRHQDTVASRAWLTDLAQQVGDDAALASAVARLHTLEEQRARSADRDYEKALRRLPRTRGGEWPAGGID